VEGTGVTGREAAACHQGGEAKQSVSAARVRVDEGRETRVEVCKAEHCVQGRPGLVTSFHRTVEWDSDVEEP